MPDTANEIFSFIEERLEISNLPDRDCPPPGSTIALGDMHGRVVKLIAELWRRCAISNITSAQYQDLIRLEQKSGNELSQEDLALFEKIMNSMVVNPTLKTTFTDLIADRGNADEWQYDLHKGGNDWFNLRFVSKISRIIAAILYSNHDPELSDRNERELRFDDSRFQKVHDYFFNTARQLQILIDRNLIDKATVKSLIKEYVRLLQPLYYLRGVILSHSPAGDEQIIKLARQLNVFVPSNILSPDTICDEVQNNFFKIINGTGEVFRKNAEEGTLHQIHDYYHYNPEGNMLDFVTHNREHNGLIRNACLYYANANLADKYGIEPANAFSLYTDLGQRRCAEGEECSGISRVLIIKLEPASPEIEQEDSCSTRQDMQDSAKQINYEASLWHSIYDSCYSIVRTGVSGFIMGAALGFLVYLLEKFANLEQQKINLLKAIAGLLILGGVFLDESEESRVLISTMIIRFMLQSMPNMAPQNELARVLLMSSVTGVAIAASTTDSWPSFFSTAGVKTGGGVSAYYGYSLGNALMSNVMSKVTGAPQNVSEEPKPSSNQLKH